MNVDKNGADSVLDHDLGNLAPRLAQIHAIERGLDVDVVDRCLGQLAIERAELSTGPIRRNLQCSLRIGPLSLQHGSINIGDGC